MIWSSANSNERRCKHRQKHMLAIFDIAFPLQENVLSFCSHWRSVAISYFLYSLLSRINFEYFIGSQIAWIFFLCSFIVFNRIKSKDSCYCWYFNFILFQRATFSKSFKYTCNWKPNLECTIGQHRNITTKYNFYLPSKPGNFLFPPHGYSSPFPLQHRHLFMRAAANFLRNSRHL